MLLAGPFLGLDAAAVQAQVLQMLDVLILVSKQLAKVPGSRRVADLVKGKLEQFRSLLPLLHCLCNPGLCERHWQQVTTSKTKIINLLILFSKY